MKRVLLPLGALAWVVGVGFGLVTEHTGASIVGLLILAVTLAYLVAFRSQRALLVCFVMVFSIGGMVWAGRAVDHYQALEAPASLTGSGIVRGEMRPGVFDARIVVVLDHCTPAPCPKEAIQVRVDRYSHWTDGTRISLGPCDLKRPERFDPAFDYPMYLAKEGIGFVAERCPVETRGEPGNRFWSGLHVIREWVTTALTARLPEPEGGLARGLLLGGNDELPQSVATTFQNVGLSHIVAVSGYNLSLVAGGFFLLAILLGWYRKQAVWMTLGGIILFVFLVGAPASAVRAALMATIGMGALLVSRLSQGMTLLIVAAALMLMWNPLLLRYDLGFQFSFLATLAILASSEWRKRFRVRSFIVQGVIESFWVTLMVLLFITPISLLHFGILSPYALLANMLALPLVPLSFLFAFLVVILGWIPGVGVVVGMLAFGVLRCLVVLAEWIAALPGSQATFPELSPWMVGWWYLMLFIFFLVSQRKPVCASARS